MKPPSTLLVLLCSLSTTVAAAPEEHVARFGDEADLGAWERRGDVQVDPDKDHGGGAGGALRLDPGARAVWKLRPENGLGTVKMWVLEDASSPADPRKHGAGPRWGLIDKAGRVLTVGVVYAPYLSGDKSYATSDFEPAENERAWWQVQHLGLARKAGWHQWTFRFDGEDGLSILYDGKDLNARRQTFNWNKTRLHGFRGIALFGDETDARQSLWVDDIAVELGPEKEVTPLWPPPPPASLTAVPPPEQQTATPYARWKNGPPGDPDFFPIAVWLQDPKNAERYRAAGINLYVGLWRGPTEEQLTALSRAGMRVICSQNETALRHRDEDTIVGWMHGDEPDNAQSLGSGKGYGPPIAPEKIVEDYKRIAAADPSRPVLLNLGQGVAWDGWRGRGVRTNHPEDYPEYVQGCDIVSFDIYPAVHSNDAVAGNLWYVARGVSRLRRWSGDEKLVWNCIECTRISNPNVMPSPHQVRAEVWMSIIHGTRGLIYFVHQFKPDFIEAGLLENATMLEAVTAINRRIHSLAAVINGPTLPGIVEVESTSPLVPIHTMVKKHEGVTYLFAVSMYHLETKGSFRLDTIEGGPVAEVLGEGRTIKLDEGGFTDRFEGYDVHLYRIGPRGDPTASRE